MTNDDTTRAAAVRLMASGKVTSAEAAQIAGVTRQHTAYWARAAGIDPIALRKKYLQDLWQKATRKRRG